jgi:Protein NO VEIN, C-terminal
LGNQRTAKEAEKFLASKEPNFIIPSKVQKKNLLMAFAGANKVIYGRAFDMIKINTEFNLNDFDAVSKNLKHITLVEVKSTKRKDIDSFFNNYFFAITTAELLVAQNLGKQYIFVFVNILSGEYKEMSLQDVFAKSKGIYPTWSIRF